MGRRRSKVQATKQQFMRSRHTKEMQRMKPRNYECPWCNSFGQMFTQVQGSGRLFLLGCGNCKQGERFPKHPTFRAIDYLHFALDNKTKGFVPTFKFDRMTSKDLEYIREGISLGKVEVADIIEDDDEDVSESD